MIHRMLFGTRSFDLLKGGLDAGAQRMRTIAENVANVTTPGYGQQRVEFEELIQKAHNSIGLQCTQPGHLRASTSGSSGVPAPQVKLSTDPQPQGAVNNIDIEQELVQMKQNEIHFSALSQLVARKYKGIDDAIR